MTENLPENLYEVFPLIKAQAASMDEDYVGLFDIKLIHAGLLTINNINDSLPYFIISLHTQGSIRFN